MARPIATFSIVGFDAARREWGVAVASKFLAVGAMVPFGEAEVGAVATQAHANLAYGPQGLELLRAGLDAEAALERLTSADPGRALRQLGLVDRDGASASFTGSECAPWAGGISGHGFAAQGNVLESAATVEALAASFEVSAGAPLAARLLECLRSGQAAGGDRRGQQAAALLVVAEGAGYGGGNDRRVDLRVEDHPAPIDELARIYAVHELHFGSTPLEEWLPVGTELGAELRARLARLGYRQERLEDAFEAWAGIENLEERVRGVERVDPVVLGLLRRS
jgi:uncharacterized Ntn-hydrolase superfamily protein